MLAETGVKAGAHIAIIADAQPEYLFAVYGAMADGYVCVPLDPALSAQELRGQVQDAEAALLIAGASRMEQAREVCVPIGIPVIELEERRADPKWSHSEGGKLASLNYTG